MAGQKRQYAVTFKQEALRLLEVSGKSVRQIEAELGITPGLLNKWKQRYQLHPTTGEVKPSEQRELEAENNGGDGQDIFTCDTTPACRDALLFDGSTVGINRGTIDAFAIGDEGVMGDIGGEPSEDGAQVFLPLVVR